MKIIVVVEGGLVQGVFSNTEDESVEVIVVDHDTEGCSVGDHPSLRDIFGEVIGFDLWTPDYLPDATRNIYRAAEGDFTD